MTSELGSAIACRRATRLVVSPIAAFSWLTPSRTRSPTTTSRADGNAGLHRHICGGLQGPDGLEDGKSGKDCPLCIVLLCCRITEIRKHPVTQVLRDHATEGFHLVGATRVERSDD